MDVDLRGQRPPAPALTKARWAKGRPCRTQEGAVEDCRARSRRTLWSWPCLAAATTARRSHGAEGGASSSAAGSFRYYASADRQGLRRDRAYSRRHPRPFDFPHREPSAWLGAIVPWNFFSPMIMPMEDRACTGGRQFRRVEARRRWRRFPAAAPRQPLAPRPGYLRCIQ